jgi:hypothetical protein
MLQMALNISMFEKKYDQREKKNTLESIKSISSLIQSVRVI